jgi:hypothetical protein
LLSKIICKLKLISARASLNPYKKLADYSRVRLKKPNLKSKPYKTTVKKNMLKLSIVKSTERRGVSLNVIIF